MSEVKVNKISPRTNCGTVQLGDSGDTITIPAGATITNNGTQTGFGRTGTVNWDTTAKTASFTAVSGNGYFVNTTSGAITVTLPASPSAGDIVALQDYAGTWGTNNITIGRNGSNIGGSSNDATLSDSNQSITLVYVDATRGWQTVNDSTQSVAGPKFVTATGGTVTCCGDYKIHTFTGPGTFCVSCAGNICGSNTVSYMVVAGGGSGGAGSSSPADSEGGGGGAGGFREGKASTDCYSASPLVAPAGLSVTASPYPITVGGGGATNTCHATAGNPGSNSIFSSITSTGGGSGGSRNAPNCAPARADSGGSGGGAGQADSPTSYPGAGNTPPVSPPQGNPGGNAAFPSSPITAGAGGGGGATAAGGSATPGPTVGGPGGAGATTSISASPTAYAGGGGGAGEGSPSPGGTGGGGKGAVPGVEDNTAGTANTGGGGGGGGGTKGIGEAGGSGIVIIRYKYQ